LKPLPAAETGAAFVVITGGEPLHHNLDELTAAIRSGCSQPVHLETSGVDRLSGAPDWITLSPKRHKPPRQDVVQACHELKVVVHEPADLLFAEVVGDTSTPGLIGCFSLAGTARKALNSPSTKFGKINAGG
jgi:organic radical activating enzyme